MWFSGMTMFPPSGEPQVQTFAAPILNFILFVSRCRKLEAGVGSFFF
jgi:hypothetical protein